MAHSVAPTTSMYEAPTPNASFDFDNMMDQNSVSDFRNPKFTELKQKDENYPRSIGSEYDQTFSEYASKRQVQANSEIHNTEQAIKDLTENLYGFNLIYQSNWLQPTSNTPQPTIVQACITNKDTTWIAQGKYLNILSNKEGVLKNKMRYQTRIKSILSIGEKVIVQKETEPYIDVFSSLEDEEKEYDFQFSLKKIPSSNIRQIAANDKYIVVAYMNKGVGEVNMTRLNRLKQEWLLNEPLQQDISYEPSANPSALPSQSQSPEPTHIRDHIKAPDLENIETWPEDQVNVFSKKFGIDVYSFHDGKLLHRMVVKGEYRFINISQWNKLFVGVYHTAHQESEPVSCVFVWNLYKSEMADMMYKNEDDEWQKTQIGDLLQVSLKSKLISKLHPGFEECVEMDSEVHFTEIEERQILYFEEGRKSLNGKTDDKCCYLIEPNGMLTVRPLDDLRNSRPISSNCQDIWLARNYRILLSHSKNLSIFDMNKNREIYSHSYAADATVEVTCQNDSIVVLLNGKDLYNFSPVNPEKELIWPRTDEDKTETPSQTFRIEDDRFIGNAAFVQDRFIYKSFQDQLVMLQTDYPGFPADLGCETFTESEDIQGIIGSCSSTRYYITWSHPNKVWIYDIQHRDPPRLVKTPHDVIAVACNDFAVAVMMSDLTTSHLNYVIDIYNAKDLQSGWSCCGKIYIPDMPQDFYDDSVLLMNNDMDLAVQPRSGGPAKLIQITRAQKSNSEQSEDDEWVLKFENNEELISCLIPSSTIPGHTQFPACLATVVHFENDLKDEDMEEDREPRQRLTSTLRLYNTKQKRISYDHEFNGRIIDTVLAPNLQFLFVLVQTKTESKSKDTQEVDRLQTKIYVLHLKRLSIFHLYTTRGTYDFLGISHRYFMLMDTSYGEEGTVKITKIAFKHILGERFLEEVRNLQNLSDKSSEDYTTANDSTIANDNQTPKYNPALKDRILYPQMLDITHFYSYFIIQIPKESQANKSLRQILAEAFDQGGVFPIVSHDENEFQSCLQMILGDKSSHIADDHSTENNIVKCVITHKNLENFNKDQHTLHQQCMYSQHLRIFEGQLESLNRTQISSLALIYEKLLIKVKTPQFPWDSDIKRLKFTGYVAQPKQFESKSDFKDKIDYQVSSIAMPLNIVSAETQHFNDSLLKLSRRNRGILVSSFVKELTKELWKQAKYKIYFFAFYNILFTILLSFHVLNLADDSHDMGHVNTYILIILLAMDALACLMTLWKLWYELLNYFKDFWNYLDMLSNSTALIYILFYLYDFIPHDRHIILAFTCLFCWLRSIGVYRCSTYDGRNFIRTVIYSFYRIWKFLLLVLVYIVGHSFTMIAIEKSDISIGEYDQYLLRSYNMVYANFDEIDYPTIPQQIIFIVGSIILPLVLLNLLITYMADKYEELQTQNKVEDIRDRIRMIQQVGRIDFWTKWIQSVQESTQMRYMHLCKAKKDDEEKEINWEGRTVMLQKQIDKVAFVLEDRIIKSEQRTAERFEVMMESINELTKMMKEKQDTLEKNVKKLETHILVNPSPRGKSNRKTDHSMTMQPHVLRQLSSSA